MLFQSTPPHGERRRYRHRGAWYLRISIHAPRMGSDKYPQVCLSVRTYFNPRSRMGSDLQGKAWDRLRSLFQSTLPHGERLYITGTAFMEIKFQSTLPHGERPEQFYPEWAGRIISIHAPAWGATKNRNPSNRKKKYFNPRPPHGERHGIRQGGVVSK